MADDIEVHFNSQRGELLLSCAPEAFARVRDAVVAVADLNTIAIDGVPAGVRYIVVDELKAIKVRGRLYDGFALLGCGVVSFALLFVLVIGVITIAGWTR